MAHELIRACLAEDWFTPEGLELYRWHWVPADWCTFRMKARRGLMSAPYYSDPRPAGSQQAEVVPAYPERLYPRVLRGRGLQGQDRGR